MTSTAEGLVQRAVQRDLERVALVLTTQLHIGRERRHAVAHHVLWLLAMMTPTDDDLVEAMLATDRAARAFHGSADRRERRELLNAVGRLQRLQADRCDWVNGEIVKALGRHVHWAVDGLEGRLSDHLVRMFTPRSGFATARMRADVYRYRKNLLWGGTPAYALTGRLAPVGV